MFSVLRNRDYLLYWIGAAVSFTGSHLQGTVQGWYVFSLTGGSFAVGLVSFFGQLPMTLTLLGGAVADRVHKKRLLITTQSVMMATAFLLGFLVARNLAGVWTIAVIALIGGVAGAFDSPARHSLAVHLVGKESLGNAIGMNSAAFNTARIVGPALAGALLARIGPAWCFYINGLSFVAVIAALAMIRSDTSSSAECDTALLADLTAGVRYIRKSRTLLPLVLMPGITSLFVFPYQTIMPEFAARVLGVKASGYGALMAMVGVGALIGALRMANAKHTDGRGRTILGAGFGCSIVLLTLAMCRSYALSLGLLMALGAMNVTYNATVNTTLQTLADDRFRARVVGAYVFVFLGISPIGNLAAGALARGFGPRFPLAVGGIGMGVMMLWLALTRPAIRNL